MFKVGDMVKMKPKAYLYNMNENAIGYIIRTNGADTFAFPILVQFITELINVDYRHKESTWAFKSSELEKIA